MSLTCSTSSTSSKEASPMELSPPHPTSSTSYTIPDEISQLSTKRRQRTKRQRAYLPPLVASSSTVLLSEKENDDEDMANCLILLSVGHVGRCALEDHKLPPSTAPQCLYECKTCNKSFPTFQALGGHRASHKKFKNTVPTPAVETTQEDKQVVLVEDAFQSTSAQLQHLQSISAISMINGLDNLSKSRVHECSICRSVFSSGQALGGHMRRHRSTTTFTEQADKKEIKTTPLTFDLNLPAPLEDDHADYSLPSFPFSAAQLFTPSSLVDCHY